MMGPVTRTSGSCGNTTVPSSTASMLTVSLKSARYARKPSSKSGPPPGASSVRR